MATIRVTKGLRDWLNEQVKRGEHKSVEQLLQATFPDAPREGDPLERVGSPRDDAAAEKTPSKKRHAAPPISYAAIKDDHASLKHWTGLKQEPFKWVMRKLSKEVRNIFFLRLSL